ncbi:MAG: PIG-L family deacetylase [Balneolaceae bacterium]|nr:PIG-L family deacetylase [Balneolaceae bacterium]
MNHRFAFRTVSTLLLAALLTSAGWQAAYAQAPPQPPAAQLDYQPRILLVTAHPDDDAIYAATVFKTTHLLGGVVDLALMTNGEGGYRYSTLGNYIYGKELDKEEVGRAWLPNIRKQELMAGGEIVGMRKYFFFEQLDRQYSLDPAVPMEEWDADYIVSTLRETIRQEGYDFVFTMMPYPGTHAHHKASAILALRAVEGMAPEERPLVLATSMASADEEPSSFEMLEDYPLTRLDRSVTPFVFDRTQTFGHENELNYKMIANWVIAEHKSQGTMQQLMNRGDLERYWYYGLNPPEGEQKVRRFFEAVNAADIYARDDSTAASGG